MPDPGIALLGELGVRLPVLAAPMAGGPSTPELVGRGLVRGQPRLPGRRLQVRQRPRSPAQGGGRHRGGLRGQPVRTQPGADRARRLPPVRRGPGRRGRGLRPGPGRGAADRGRRRLGGQGRRGRRGPARPGHHDLRPPAGGKQAPAAAGRVPLGITVTSAGEARRAADAGADLLVVQGSAAGGHSGTMTPERPAVQADLAELVREIRSVSALPVIAAGGIAGRTTSPGCCGRSRRRCRRHGAAAHHRERHVGHAPRRPGRPPVRPHRSHPVLHRAAGPRAGQPLDRRARRRGSPRLSRRAPPDRRPAAGRPRGRPAAGAPVGRDGLAQRAGRTSQAGAGAARAVMIAAPRNAGGNAAED